MHNIMSLTHVYPHNRWQGHNMDWVTEPHTLDPVIAAAVFHKENLLTKGNTGLSDSPDRVLRASEIIPDTFEKLVARLTSSERRELFREMRP